MEKQNIESRKVSETGRKQPKSGALSECSRCDHCRVTRSGGGQRTVPGRDGRKLLDDVWGTELLRPMTCRAVTSNKCPNIEHVLLMFRTVITSIDVPCLPCCLSLVITGCHTSIESYTSPNNDCDYRAPRARNTAVWPGVGLLPGYLLGYSRWISHSSDRHSHCK